MTILLCSALSIFILSSVPVFLLIRKTRFNRCLHRIEGRVRSSHKDKCTVYVESLDRDYTIRGPESKISGLSVNSEVTLFIDKRNPKNFYCNLQYKKSNLIPIFTGIILSSIPVVTCLAMEVQNLKQADTQIQVQSRNVEFSTFDDEPLTEIWETIETEEISDVEPTFEEFYAEDDRSVVIPYIEVSTEPLPIFEGDMLSLNLSTYEDYYYVVGEDSETETATESEEIEETTTTEVDIIEDVEEPEELSIQLPISLIIDTDFASDCDDILAIRLANVYRDLGILDVKGIALSTTYSRSPLAVHALCKADGYGLTPVSMDTSGNGVQVHTEYVDVMYEAPKDTDEYSQPVQMYRQILSQSPTRVNIITLGFVQNLEDLLKSGPDGISPYSGTELVQQKVDTLYIVGGTDSGRPSFNFYYGGERCVKAAKTVCANWPGTIVYLTSDLTQDTYCGQFYNNEDSSKRDLATKALAANNQQYGVVAWDVFSMYCAVQHMLSKLDENALYLEQGNYYISDTGASLWQDTALLRYRICKTRDGGDYNPILNQLLHSKFGGA